MPATKFMIGENNEHMIEIICKWWGKETYIIDGSVVRSRFSPGFSGVREFKVGGYHLTIEINSGPRNYHSRALVDGSVVIEELFPDYTAQVEKWSNPPYSTVVKGVVFCATALITMLIINAFN